jgi:hypothetical protein
MNFKWGKAEAWACQTVEKDGKFYLYVTLIGKNPGWGRCIGVAVSDSPTGPFVDAKGAPLVTDKTTLSPNGWDDIDPTVLVDGDGAPWMVWGNPNCYMVKLKPNMIDMDGPIKKLPMPNYTEGPRLYKHDGIYYLLYSGFAWQWTGKKTCYATAKKITGPWTYRGVLVNTAKGCSALHTGVVDFKGRSYYFSHNADLVLNGVKGGPTKGWGTLRSIFVQYLYHLPDGSLRTDPDAAGVVVPMQKVPPPPPFPEPVKNKSDEGVIVTQNVGFAPQAWSGEPIIATVDNPYYKATYCASFNANQNCEFMGQTFKFMKTSRWTA